MSKEENPEIEEPTDKSEEEESKESSASEETFQNEEIVEEDIVEDLEEGISSLETESSELTEVQGELTADDIDNIDALLDEVDEDSSLES